MTAFASRWPLAAPGSPLLPATKAALLVGLLSVAIAAGAQDRVVRNGDYIAAVVNQELVTAGEVERRVERAQAEAARAGVRMPPEGELRRQALDALIDERAMITTARESGMRVDDAEVDRAVQNIAQQNQITMPVLRERLVAEGIDYGPVSYTHLDVYKRQYTSCPLGTGDEPDWQLRMRSVEMDFDTNEGIAEGAVLRFLGLPILALPSLSFPLNDARKSGWLPPTINLDNRSGLELLVPYYWNIAPNRDATLAPRIITRRGPGLDAEFRYLEPGYGGTVQLNWLPHDRLAGRSRNAVGWQHEGRLGAGFEYRADLARVSDPAWWKDFPDSNRGFTPRLLPLHVAVERPFGLGGGQGLVYARATRWQVLQASDSFITAPYERSPQVGASWGGALAGWAYALEAEYNRFTLPHDQQATTSRLPGERAHLLGSVSHPMRAPGWWLVPKLSLNAATYNACLLYTSRCV